MQDERFHSIRRPRSTFVAAVVAAGVVLAGCAATTTTAEGEDCRPQSSGHWTVVDGECVKQEPEKSPAPDEPTATIAEVVAAFSSISSGLEEQMVAFEKCYKDRCSVMEFYSPGLTNEAGAMARAMEQFGTNLNEKFTDPEGDKYVGPDELRSLMEETDEDAFRLTNASIHFQSCLTSLGVDSKFGLDPIVECDANRVRNAIGPMQTTLDAWKPYL